VQDRHLASPGGLLHRGPRRHRLLIFGFIVIGNFLGNTVFMPRRIGSCCTFIRYRRVLPCMRKGLSLVQLRTATRTEICRMGKFLAAVMAELGGIGMRLFGNHLFLHGFLDYRATRGRDKFRFRFCFLHDPQRGFLNGPPDRLLGWLPKGFQGTFHGNFHRRLDFRFPDRRKTGFGGMRDFPVVISSYQLTFRRFCNLPHLRSPGRDSDLRFRLRLFFRNPVRGDETFYRRLLFMILEGFPHRMKFLPVHGFYRGTECNRFFILFFRFRGWPAGGFFRTLFFVE